MIKMRKILLLIFILSLFVFNVNAAQKIGPDLIIESITMNPFPVIPGDNFDLIVELRNSNTRKTIQELEFTLDAGYPFSSDDIIRIGSLAPNEREVVSFKVNTESNAISGINNLKLIYEDNTDIRYVSDEINVDVKSNTKDLSIISIKTIPSEIIPGSEIDVVVTLKNMVSVLMKEIELELDLSGDVPFIPIGSTTKKTLDSLNKGNSKDFLFNIAVDAEAESKVHKIPLILNYKDEFGNNYTMETLTGLKVATDPELIYTIESSEIYSVGSSGHISIKIVNPSLADIKFLNVELLESEDYNIISSSNVYLGNLESDDYETADFNIYANSNKENIPIKLKVTYKNAFNEEYHSEETVMLPLYSKSELTKFGLGGNGGLSTTLFYLVLAIFIYLFIVDWKKERSIPKSLKNTVMKILRFIRKIIKSIRLRTLKRGLLKVILFFKEK